VVLTARHNIECKIIEASEFGNRHCAPSRGHPFPSMPSRQMHSKKYPGDQPWAGCFPGIVVSMPELSTRKSGMDDDVLKHFRSYRLSIEGILLVATERRCVNRRYVGRTRFWGRPSGYRS
jgi:hypothetical protein